MRSWGSRIRVRTFLGRMPPTTGICFRRANELPHPSPDVLKRVGADMKCSSTESPLTKYAQYANHALDGKRKHHSDAGDVASNIGWAMEEDGLYEDAIEWHTMDVWHQQHVPEPRSKKETEALVTAWRRRGECFSMLNEYAAAAEQFQNALKVDEIQLSDKQALCLLMGEAHRMAADQTDEVDDPEDTQRLKGKLRAELEAVAASRRAEALREHAIRWLLKAYDLARQLRSNEKQACALHNLSLVDEAGQEVSSQL